MVFVPWIIVLMCFVFRAHLLSALDEYEEWHKSNVVLGFLVYMLLFITTVPLMFPPSTIIILGAFICSQMYGKVAGFLITFFITLFIYPIASIICFEIGKKFMKSLIQKHLISKVRLFQAIDKSIVDLGLKMTVLLRMQTGITWMALNYILSVTNCELKIFYFGTLIGMVPKLTNWVLIGVNL